MRQPTILLAALALTAACADVTAPEPEPEPQRVEFAWRGRMLVATAAFRGGELRVAALPEGIIVQFPGARPRRLSVEHARELQERAPELAPQRLPRVAVTWTDMKALNTDGEDEIYDCWDCYEEISDAFFDDGCCRLEKWGVGIATVALALSSRAMGVTCTPVGGVWPAGCGAAITSWALSYASLYLAGIALIDCEKRNRCGGDDLVLLNPAKHEVAVCWT